MSTRLSYQTNARVWGFCPCIASICQLFSHGVLDPCYSHGPLTYNDWLIILLLGWDWLVGRVLLRYTLLQVA
jgi:hypothetical protein